MQKDKQQPDLQNIRDDADAPAGKYTQHIIITEIQNQRCLTQREIKLTTCPPPGPAAHNSQSPELFITITEESSTTSTPLQMFQ